MPDWFDLHLDPDSAAYREQMMRLWREITGRENYAAVDEDTPEVASQDAIYRPAFYGTGDAAFAGGQLMALGHVLLRSGLKPGDRVLKYGAGMGQIALAFARLGMTVDTVDINPAFCSIVQQSAEHFRVAMTPHHASFGYNPAGTAHAYDLILFYESFHHCIDFAELIPRLRTLLKPGGRVILAGEPIAPRPAPEIPYPWGFRLDWENVSIMRLRGWMELGFQEDYLLAQFVKAGFNWQIHKDPNSHWATIYSFTVA